MYDKKRYWLGPGSCPQKYLKLLPFSKLFNLAAYNHDVGYGIGGSFRNKYYIDITFKRQMLKVCKLNPLSYLFAIFYFLLVFTLGYFFFYWKKNNDK